jgi:ankyrin repeat protein
MMSSSSCSSCESSDSNDERVGSIKFVLKGNILLQLQYELLTTLALDSNIVLPLHIACAHHESASVVQYLLGLDTATLDTADREGNTALHYVHAVVQSIIPYIISVSVSKRDAHKKLPSSA